MNVQSLSIVVPTKRCVNDCPFCVSKMHDNDYDGQLDDVCIEKRLKFAANIGVNSVIFTGTGEALQNKNYIRRVSEIMAKLGNPFPNIELQTTGVMLTGDNLVMLKTLGFNTISLSVSDIFDSANNKKIIGIPRHLSFELTELIKRIKVAGFNVRLSINMINVYDRYATEDIVKQIKFLEPDQVTFRKMYFSESSAPENQWVKNNACKQKVITSMYSHMETDGEKLYTLPFGSRVYSLEGMSVVLDDDCMNKHNTSALKYIILRENGKLYCRWDDLGSLIF